MSKPPVFTAEQVALLQAAFEHVWSRMSRLQGDLNDNASNVATLLSLLVERGLLTPEQFEAAVEELTATAGLESGMRNLSKPRDHRSQPHRRHPERRRRRLPPTGAGRRGRRLARLLTTSQGLLMNGRGPWLGTDGGARGGWRRGRASRAPSWRAVVAVSRSGCGERAANDSTGRHPSPLQGDGGSSEPHPERLTATGEPCWRARGLPAPPAPTRPAVSARPRVP